MLNFPQSRSVFLIISTDHHCFAWHQVVFIDDRDNIRHTVQKEHRFSRIVLLSIYDFRFEEAVDSIILNDFAHFGHCTTHFRVKHLHSLNTARVPLKCHVGHVFKLTH